MMGILVLVASADMASGDMPPNVRCAIEAQQSARNTGSDYQNIYKRKFELCMLRAMPRERQTAFLIQKLKPYVALSPGTKPHEPAQQKGPEFTGTWIRVSPNVWRLER